MEPVKSEEHFRSVVPNCSYFEIEFYPGLENLFYFLTS
ncbi:hypothetical protein LEP1GSC193_3977 [Leptospira alstonii serovar Pingchang str. 80-412]|uniref:Uncharacterized protein n=2 Tax=Leptospira alstonii TaxID=28452 RepID=M6CJI4_9LEPT|nr:hypothetical protein LEP1GSC194_4126 [Leptospira alstonii serovar Sichuan str. 79601]EQA81346.1 hypothetical protein LEP1GSC193_3977 [Leptospira alstonii serovar Pingchang str. 80-412]